jgi:hypothetical protein
MFIFSITEDSFNISGNWAPEKGIFFTLQVVCSLWKTNTILSQVHSLLAVLHPSVKSDHVEPLLIRVESPISGPVERDLNRIPQGKIFTLMESCLDIQ